MFRPNDRPTERTVMLDYVVFQLAALKEEELRRNADEVEELRHLSYKTERTLLELEMARKAEVVGGIGKINGTQTETEIGIETKTGARRELNSVKSSEESALALSVLRQHLSLAECFVNLQNVRTPHPHPFTSKLCKTEHFGDVFVN